MADESFDCVVVGAGPGGYVAAIRAAQLGLRAAVVERAELGGVCLNWGCIPTKALLRSAELYDQMGRAAEFGLAVEGLSFDLAKIVRRSRATAKRLAGGVRHLLKKNGVPVRAGQARLDGPGRLRVAGEGDERIVRAPHIVLATGARPRILPGLEPDGRIVWTYREAMVPEALPRSVLVVGAGAIGIEFASFYRALGADVTVVEIEERILPQEDAEIADLARAAFEKRGIAFRTGARVAGLARTPDGAVATVSSADGGVEELRVERVISAAGIVGNVEDLGLETTAARVERGHVVTDAWGRTDEPGLYAIGDVAGPPWLAHKASHEGVACVEAIAGAPGAHAFDASGVPACTYSTPQIASLGRTEAALRAEGREVRVGRFPLRANGRALALGEPEGLVKTIFDASTGELLGAHLIGPEVTELVGLFAAARTLETTETELIRTILPHPTLSEALHESVLDAFGRALHL